MHPFKKLIYSLSNMIIYTPQWNPSGAFCVQDTLTEYTPQWNPSTPFCVQD